MKYLVTIFMLFCTGAALLTAQSSAPDLLAQALKAAGLPQAAEQKLFLDVQDYRGGRISPEALRRTVKRPDGGMTESVEVPGLYTLTTEIGPELELLRCEKKYLSPALVEAAKADRVLITLDRARKEWTVTTYLGSKVQSVRTAGRQSQVWGMDALAVVFQVLASGGQTSPQRQDLNFDVLMSSGDVFGAQVRVHRTKDLAALAPRYRFPDRFRRLTGGQGELTVFEMGFTGVVGFVYPHKFYYVYSAAPGTPYLGMFGEDPDKNPSYQAVAADFGGEK